MIVTLPGFIFEKNLPTLLNRLGAANGEQKVIFDFEKVRYFIPGAIVTICAKIKGWHREGKDLYFRNHKKNAAFKYLQRINFFTTVGLDLPEEFVRKPGSPDFIPLRELT